MEGGKKLQRIQPTFSDGPSTFLAGLGEKPAQRSEGTGTFEATKLRNELTGRIQGLAKRQETLMRHHEGQIAQIAPQMVPKIEAIERRQAFAKEQIEQIRQALMNTVDVNVHPLRTGQEDVGSKVDEFVKSQVEAKVAPIRETLKQSRVNLDVLVGGSQASIKEVRAQLRETGMRLEATTQRLSRKPANFTGQLDDIEARLATLGAAFNMSNDDGEDTDQASVEKRLCSLERAIDHLVDDILPNVEDEISARFELVGGDGDGVDLRRLEKKMAVMSALGLKLTGQSKKDVEAVEKMCVESQEVVELAAKTDEEVRGKLNEMGVCESDRLRSGPVDGGEVIQAMKEDLANTVRSMKEALKMASNHNDELQRSTLAQIQRIREQLEDDGGALSQIKGIEERILECVNDMKAVRDTWSTSHETGESTSVALGRITELENRLAAAEALLSERDGRPAVRGIVVNPVADATAIVPAVAAEGSDEKARERVHIKDLMRGDKVFDMGESTQASVSAQ